MKVFKFGGSSLANPTNIIKVKNIIINEINSNGKDLVIVLSAVFGITNLLFKICDNLKNKQSIDSEIKTFREKFLNIIEELLYDRFKDTCTIFLEETINT
ncbi:MAG: hypothetical protein NZM44_00970, partial [Candidatus Calescibacterium sp.]|nr:hypothetical protein [Candidatus Calescibacterium sp.]